MVQTALIFGVLVPAVVAAAFLLPLRLRAGLGDRTARLLGGLAVSLGFLAAYAGLGFAPLKPDDAWNWLPWLGLGAAVLGLVDRPGWLAAVVRLAGAAVAAWLLVPVWEANAAWRLDARVLLGLVIFLAWTADRRMPDAPGRVWPVLLAVIAAVSAVLLEHGGSGKLAQLAGALAAALAAAAVVPPFNGTPPPGVGSVAAVLLPGLLASGFFETHSAIPRVSYLLPAVAMLTLDQTVLLPPGRRAGAVLLVLALLAAAVGLAVWMEPIDWNELFPSAAPQPEVPG
jgi:hypothetical protein